MSHIFAILIALLLLISSLGYRVGIRGNAQEVGASVNKIDVANALVIGSFLFLYSQLVWLLPCH
ncbi:hypothetical protein [Metallibacterium scheffleri]|uniref:hypothetical protein n=1 Tax=Metallibacterium scheffleri TaxID=993689 RepID=UPI00109F8444|nr:hypothetical protein [Metallibacterium scheffleri]